MQWPVDLHNDLFSNLLTSVSRRKFLVSVCDVPDPQDRFNMDEFSELLIVNKPLVYISVGELLNTHKVPGYAHNWPGGQWVRCLWVRNRNLTLTLCACVCT